jgi:hypothetical protein
VEVRIRASGPTARVIYIEPDIARDAAVTPATAGDMS